MKYLEDRNLREEHVYRFNGEIKKICADTYGRDCIVLPMSNNHLRYMSLDIKGEKMYASKKSIGKSISFIPHKDFGKTKDNNVFIVEGESDGFYCSDYTSNVLIVPGAGTLKRCLDDIVLKIKESFEIDKVNIISCFDNDEAGNEAHCDLVQLLSSVSIVRFNLDDHNDLREFLDDLNFTLDGFDDFVSNLIQNKVHKGEQDSNSKIRNLKLKETTKKIYLPIDFDEENSKFITSHEQENSEIVLISSNIDGKSDFESLANYSIGKLVNDNSVCLELDNEVFLDKLTSRQKDVKVFEDIKNEIKGSIYLKDESLYTFLTLISLFSYFQRLFDHSFYLSLVGPKGSGKSFLTKLLANLCFNGEKISSSSTEASIRRSLDIDRGTLCFDDCEFLSNVNTRNSSLASMLNEGYEKDAIYKLCNTDDKNKVQKLNVGGLKIFNGINGLNEITRSRSYTLMMHKAPQDIYFKSLKEVLSQRGRLRARQLAFVHKSFNRVYEIYQEKLHSMSKERETDLILGLLSIACYLDEILPESKIELQLLEAVEFLKEDEISHESFEDILREVLMAKYISEKFPEDFNVTHKELKDKLMRIDSPPIPDRSQPLTIAIGTTMKNSGLLLKSNTRGKDGTGTIYTINAYELMRKK